MQKWDLIGAEVLAGIPGKPVIILWASLLMHRVMLLPATRILIETAGTSILHFLQFWEKRILLRQGESYSFMILPIIALVMKVYLVWQVY